MIDAIPRIGYIFPRPLRLLKFIGAQNAGTSELDQELAAEGIEMSAPHKSNRVKPATQDGRVLGR